MLNRHFIDCSGATKDERVLCFKGGKGILLFQPSIMSSSILQQAYMKVKKKKTLCVLFKSIFTVWLFTGEQDAPVSVSTVHIQELYSELVSTWPFQFPNPLPYFFYYRYVKYPVVNSVGIMKLVCVCWVTRWILNLSGIVFKELVRTAQRAYCLCYAI
jgi:hypothetical protein